MDVALGSAVRIRRRSLDMSQEALAQLCGISFQQVQKYENGINRISFSRLVQIARALQCRVSDLVALFDGGENGGPFDTEVLSQVRTPGAMELLSAYVRLAPATRSKLVDLTRSAADELSAARAQAIAEQADGAPH